MTLKKWHVTPSTIEHSSYLLDAVSLWFHATDRKVNISIASPSPENILGNLNSDLLHILKNGQGSATVKFLALPSGEAFEPWNFRQGFFELPVATDVTRVLAVPLTATAHAIVGGITTEISTGKAKLQINKKTGSVQRSRQFLSESLQSMMFKKRKSEKDGVEMLASKVDSSDEDNTEDNADAIDTQMMQVLGATPFNAFRKLNEARLSTLFNEADEGDAVDTEAVVKSAAGLQVVSHTQLFKNVKTNSTALSREESRLKTSMVKPLCIPTEYTDLADATTSARNRYPTLARLQQFGYNKL